LLLWGKNPVPLLFFAFTLALKGWEALQLRRETSLLCWRLVNLSPALWLSGGRAVIEGSGGGGSSGCAGEHGVALPVPGRDAAPLR